MTTLTVEKTYKTPTIVLDAETGILELRGKSIPEDANVFYLPIYNWLEEYTKNPAPKTVFNIQLDYFNTSSSKCLMDLFKLLHEIFKNKKGEVMINWYYNEMDEDMLESGEDIKSLIFFPFNLISIK